MLSTLIAAVPRGIDSYDDPAIGHLIGSNLSLQACQKFRKDMLHLLLSEITTRVRRVMMPDYGRLRDQARACRRESA